MKNSFLLLAFSSMLLSASAQPVEWKDVAPIFYRECATCHRPGEIGEDYLNMMGYSQLINSPSFTGIPYQIDNRLMPPWKADPEYHHFLDERILLQEEINLIDSFVNQVASGSYEPGDTTEPPPPVFTEGSQLGQPDLVLKMAEPHVVPGNYENTYHCFVLPTNLLENKGVNGLEFRPGNSKVVHHVFIYTCEDNTADSVDALTPEYGYPSFGGAGEGVNANFLTLYGPGMVPRFYPKNSGLKFKAGTRVIIQIHYAPSPVEVTDQSSVNLFFEDDTEMRIVKGQRVGENYTTEPVFFILKDKVLTFHSEYVLDTTYSMFSIAPHMHLLGQSFKLFAVPAPGDTIPLCYVPKWDFNWQLLYNYNNFIILPKGTIVGAEATYDNTENNPNNPNSPPQNVGYGEETGTEMFKYFMNLLVYQPGDEDVVFDTSWQPVGVPPIEGIVTTPQLYAPVPNPSSDQAVFNYYLPEAAVVRFYVYDLSGKMVGSPMSLGNLSAGFQRKTLDVSSWKPGNYYFTLEAAGKRITKAFIVQR